MSTSLVERTRARALLQHRIWMWSIWSWLIGGIGFGLCFGLMAGFIPPPSEAWSAEQVAAFYEANRTLIRLGLIGAMFATALLMPFFTVVSLEMWKIEGRMPVLAIIQFGFAVIIVCFFQGICLLWLQASFRPEISPEIIRALNDYGWLVWTILIPTTAGQFVLMGIAGFLDLREEPLWPRWACFANFWLAFGQAGGAFSVFFKTGPFSWNGVIGYWIPVLSFAAVMTMNMVLLLRQAKREAMTQPNTESCGGVPVAG